ncbi:hypothetical protein H1R20_g6511, partial [Candolleomyces eurysporus]
MKIRENNSPASTTPNGKNIKQGTVGSNKALEVAGINTDKLEDKTSALVDRFGLLSLVAAVNLAIVALADIVVSTVFLTTRGSSGEEGEGGGGDEGEDANKHGG